MEAIRNIYSVENKQIVINLPANFKHKSVEVIVLPVYEYEKTEQVSKNKKSEHLEKLLNVSVWKDTDVQQITDSGKLLNEWKIEKF